MVRQSKRRYLSGSTVIEAAYLFPVIMVIWLLILYTLFYYHDKNILSGAAYESAVVGSEIVHEDKTGVEEAVTQYAKERIQGKLIFFPGAQVSVKKGKNTITVTVSAYAKWMRLSVEKGAALTEPEKEIRKVNIRRQQLEGITGE